MLARQGDKSVIVVRPYGRAIRERVYGLLGAVGFDMKSARVLEKHTPDSDVVDFLARRAYDALLVPFHAHRDCNGELVNGLSVLALLEERGRFSKCPVFMPISSMGMSSATLMLSRDASMGGLSPTLRKHVLFMPENELESQELRRKVAAHAHARAAPAPVQRRARG